jgi:uncharacterized protein YjbJ (UPF0337 family)
MTIIKDKFAPIRNAITLSGVERNTGICRPLEVPLRRNTMDWNRVEGNWKQMKGKIKEKWGKLTDDDLTQINGRRDQLEGKIQQRYGYAKDQSKKEVDDWFSRLP